MAGHNKWSKIKHVKAVQDVKKGKEFSKAARLIMQAARKGGADPSANLQLKYALDQARACNMPKDNVERAIKKGTGEIEGAHLPELRRLMRRVIGYHVGDKPLASQALFLGLRKKEKGP